MNPNDILSMFGVFCLLSIFLFFQLYLIPKILDKESGWKEIYKKYPFDNSCVGVPITSFSRPCYFRYGGLLSKSYRVSVSVTDFGLHIGRPELFFFSKAILVPWNEFKFEAVSRFIFIKRIKFSIYDWKKGSFELSLSTYKRFLEIAGAGVIEKNGNLTV
jgi:hypothetical protein